MYVSQIGLLVLQDIHSSKITDLFQNLQKKKKNFGKKKSLYSHTVFCWVDIKLI